MPIADRPIDVEYDFHGGVQVASSAARNGLVAAVSIGLVSRKAAMEILQLVNEAKKQLLDTIADGGDEPVTA